MFVRSFNSKILKNKAIFLLRNSLSSLIKTEIRNKIGLISLCDPLKLNSLSEEMGTQFFNAVLEMNVAAKEHRVRACIVTGQGEAFSAGGNLTWLEDRHNHSPAANCQTMLHFYNLFLSIRHLSVPTIAAINGHAIGRELSLLLHYLLLFLFFNSPFLTLSYSFFFTTSHYSYSSTHHSYYSSSTHYSYYS